MHVGTRRKEGARARRRNSLGRRREDDDRRGEGRSCRAARRAGAGGAGARVHPPAGGAFNAPPPRSPRAPRPRLYGTCVPPGAAAVTPSCERSSPCTPPQSVGFLRHEEKNNKTADTSCGAGFRRGARADATHSAPPHGAARSAHERELCLFVCLFRTYCLPAAARQAVSMCCALRLAS